MKFLKNLLIVLAAIAILIYVCFLMIYPFMLDDYAWWISILVHVPFVLGVTALATWGDNLFKSKPQ